MKKATAMAALLVLLMTGGVPSAGMPPAVKGAETATAGVSVGEFVGPDGHIDLQAIRQSGYEGALDMEGFRFDVDPATGQPVLRPSFAAETDSDPDDFYWSPLASGMNGRVYALTVYDGKLIAGGAFTTAGGVAANHIACWDGSNWSPLGSGADNGVGALTVYDGNLIAAGGFHTAGGVEANHIASWDGSSWSPLGPGVASPGALTVYDGNLVAAWCVYEDSSGVSSWDGSSWSQLLTDVWEEYMGASAIIVHSLTVYNGKLIAAGDVAQCFCDGLPPICFWMIDWAGFVYSWDGSSWSALGSGMNSIVVGLTVYDGKLIAGGAFTTAGGVAANRVASWDGSSWSPLGSGMEGGVGALTVYDGKLIAAGRFTEAGGVAANNIASWDGSIWSPLGSGTNDDVYSLTAYNGELIVGGNFTTAGDKVAPYLASWNKIEQCCQHRGDIDHDGGVDPTDVVYFVDYFWRGGYQPWCMQEGDVDDSGGVDPLDAIYLVNYMWNGGPAPVPCP